MLVRPVFAVCLLAAACGGLLALTLRDDRPGKAAAARPAARRLPGVQPGGEVLLPTQWSLRPAGRQLPLADFPVHAAVHPDGKYLAVLHCGYSTHEVVVVDIAAARERITCRVPIDQAFYGLTWAPDGKTLYASGGEFAVVHAFAFADGLISRRTRIPVADSKEHFVVGGVAVDRAGKTLFVAGTWGDKVRLVPLDRPTKRDTADTGKDSYPYTCLPSADGKRVFVTLWGGAAVAVLDANGGAVMAKWQTESHPTEMVLSPDGKTLYVSCANSTRVSVLDTQTGRAVETIHCALYPAPSGNTPSSLCLTPDGQVLFVANSDANNLSVFNVGTRGKSKSMGFIPVGWYPTSVRYNALTKRIYVTNGKGLTSRANPQGPQPVRQPANLASLRQYIASLMRGTLGVIDLPTPEAMGRYTKAAYLCSPLRPGAAVVDDGWTPGNPIPRKLGEKSPIKYCIYIIKENRTYDQMFGDIKESNGDPSLCLFPEKVTPNHHRLARQFVLLDNFYVEGEVSADGHEWSMGAYATDFVEKVWPLSYRGNAYDTKKMSFYPAEGTRDHIARPAGGYIWDRAKEAGVSYRSYGEWIENGKRRPDGTFEDSKARVKALEGHFDPKFRGYDLDYPDVKRADRFIEELRRFEKEAKMPQLIILRLPNDHTYGTRAGKPTPTAMVADNDHALGMVVEAVSKSKFWKETAIFVVEDDAQNGPDHVDAHRTVAFVISPYTRRKYIDSTMYSTSSMLRTMELILGLKPMSQFDAAARPMYASFTAKADLAPYTAVKPDVDMAARNAADAWGAALSATFNLETEDAADDILFNEVIWRSVKGPNSPMPAPVRSAFFVPKFKVRVN